MREEFIPYQEAFELKKLGFDESCFGLYAPPSKTVFLHHYGLLSAKEQDLAPLYQQVFRFFRDKYNINTVISWRDDLLNYDISLTEMKKHGYFYYKDNFTTYEEAELACLQHLIKIVKEKQK